MFKNKCFDIYDCLDGATCLCGRGILNNMTQILQRYHPSWHYQVKYLKYLDPNSKIFRQCGTFDL